MHNEDRRLDDSWALEVLYVQAATTTNLLQNTTYFYSFVISNCCYMDAYV